MAMSQTSWDSKPQVKAGNFGEGLVDSFLERIGFTIYYPKTNGVHWFDRFATRGKEKAIALDCKTKIRRSRFMDTGLNESHYEEYLEFKKRHNIDVWLFFVDRFLGSIYGNEIGKLAEPTRFGGNDYPLTDRGTVYFPLDERMMKATSLTIEQIENIKMHETRNYSPPNNHAPIHLLGKYVKIQLEARSQ